jgi:hypothetical protein
MLLLMLLTSIAPRVLHVLQPLPLGHITAGITYMVSSMLPCGKVSRKQQTQQPDHLQ